MEREPSIVMWEPSLVIWSAPVNKVAPRLKCEGSRAMCGLRTIGVDTDRQVKSPLHWYSIRWLTGGPWPKERGPLIFIWGPRS